MELTSRERGGQLLEHVSEHPVAINADLGRQACLDLGDLLVRHGSEPVTLGRSAHDHRPAVVGVGFDRHEPRLDHLVDALADGLPRDPSFGQCTRPSSPGRQHTEDAAVGTAESGTVGPHPVRDLTPEPPLERVEGGEEMRERRIGPLARSGVGSTAELTVEPTGNVVNHIDNISKDDLQRQP